MLSILFWNYFFGNQRKIRSTFRWKRKKKDWFELPHCRPHFVFGFQKCLQNCGKIPCRVCAEATFHDFTKSENWRRRWDLNPRAPFGANGFRDRPVMTTSVLLRIYHTHFFRQGRTHLWWASAALSTAQPLLHILKASTPACAGRTLAHLRNKYACTAKPRRSSGPDGARTHNLLDAIEARCQLRHRPLI